MLNKKNNLLGWVCLLAISALSLTQVNSVQSQNRINSPYSMFGPGEVKGNEYFRNLSMGGISQGFRSNRSINYLNPASYTAIDTLSFVFEGTVFSHIYQQQTATQEQTTHYTNLGNLNFAFPVTRRWKVAAGILPWSQVGYKITDFEQDDINGRINYLYEGSGGINQVYMGHAFSIYKGLSAGINISYLFGKAEDRMLASSDSVGFHRTAWTYSDETDGLMLTYGLQWAIPLGETRRITLGASYTGPTQLDITRNRYITRALPGVGGIDTLNITMGNKGTMEIPQNLAAGVFMRFSNRIAAGVDYQTQEWSSFRTFDTQHRLNDSWQVRSGIVYNPRIETFSGLFSRLEYRAGMRFGQSFLTMADNAGTLQDFSEFGVSFGVGVPLRRSLTGLNLGFEYSRRAADTNDLINENFFRFNIGINVYERWFVRSRFF